MQFSGLTSECILGDIQECILYTDDACMSAGLVIDKPDGDLGFYGWNDVVNSLLCKLK
jgi:hypothetical protein